MLGLGIGLDRKSGIKALVVLCYLATGSQTMEQRCVISDCLNGKRGGNEQLKNEIK